MTNLIRTFLLAATVASLTHSASAAVIFVNNHLGSDAADGSSAQIIGKQAGPVRTISKALKISAPGDTIYIANTGRPYYDSLSFVGPRLSGSGLRPLLIRGNGATLTGAMRLPPTAWLAVGENLFKVVPYRKGHFQLVRDGKALAEVRPAEDESWLRVPDLQPNEWCAYKGAIYFQAENNVDPSEHNFAIARRDCGITLLDVHDVMITDIVIRHFRLDGIQLHDRADNIVLDNVVVTENGRAGVTVRGTSVVNILRSSVVGNRDHSLLIEEFGGVDATETEIDLEPTVR